MAELNKTVLGRLSGAVGDVVFRQRSGKNFVGTKPSSFIPGNDPASVARRERFALAIQFAGSINSVSELKSVWKKSTPSGLSPFNHMIQINYHSIVNNEVSDIATLGPKPDFGVSASSISLSSAVLQVDLNAIGSLTGINSSIEQSVQMASLVCLSDPTSEDLNPNAFIGKVSGIQAISLVTPLSFTIDLSPLDSALYDKFQNHKGLFLLYTLDAESNVVKHSNTLIG
jgi:hypothetical protein